MRGLKGTPYARTFLTLLAPNSGLLAAAEAYGLVPAELSALLAEGGPGDADADMTRPALA
jgi:hypothetical protein